MSFFPFRREGSFSLNDLQQEMNAMFDRLWHTGISTGPLDGQKWAPSIDVLEEPEQLLVQVEVPALDVADIDVSVSNGALLIRGIREAAGDQDERRSYLRRERKFGRFSRRVELPSSADFSKIDATCRNGLLEIVVRKKPEAQPKSIRIDAGQPSNQ